MSHGKIDLDDVLDAAWRRFRTSLADALDELDSLGTLEVRRESSSADEVAAYVRMRRDGDRVVLEAASNRSLAANQKLSKAARRHLRELGFAKSSKEALHYSIELPATHVDQAASLAVSALRAGYGVVHPSFVHAHGIHWQTETYSPEPRLKIEVVIPAGRAQIDELIDDAMRQMLGQDPTRDSDGDIAYQEGTAVIFIRSRGHSPLIRLFADMVVGVKDRKAALREIDALNREVLGIKFALHDDKVVASAELQGSPFVAEHLQILLAHLADTVSTRDAELAQRLGGRVFADPVSDDDESDSIRVEDKVFDDAGIHPIMYSLLELDAEAPGALRASVAAELCGYDSVLLNDLIRWNQDEEELWRKSRDKAYTANEHDYAQVCEAQRVHAAKTLRILRKALRRAQPS